MGSTNGGALLHCRRPPGEKCGLDVPKAETVEQVNTALGQVVQAVADCTITPHEARSMVSIFEIPQSAQDGGPGDAYLRAGAKAALSLIPAATE